MAFTRSQLREKCMIILYQNDIINKNKNDQDIDLIIKENIEIENDFVKEIVYGVITHFNEIDSLCNKYMKEWTIDRIDKTGAAIMRIAIYELKYTETPSLVVINEAIELAKKYSDEKVRKMINAVLDKIVNEE
jgi:N utilization substance protein B